MFLLVLQFFNKHMLYRQPRIINFLMHMLLNQFHKNVPKWYVFAFKSNICIYKQANFDVLIYQINTFSIAKHNDPSFCS